MDIIYFWESDGVIRKSRIETVQNFSSGTEPDQDRQNLENLEPDRTRTNTI